MSCHRLARIARKLLRDLVGFESTAAPPTPTHPPRWDLKGERWHLVIDLRTVATITPDGIFYRIESHNSWSASGGAVITGPVGEAAARVAEMGRGFDVVVPALPEVGS